MKRADVKESDGQVLEALILRGSLTIAGIASETRLSKSTVYEALHGKPQNQNVSLLARKLVKIIKEETWKTGLKMCTYTLTPAGICVCLVTSDKLWKKMDDIAERWEPLLPFMFKRWKVFKEHDLEKKIGLGLINALMNVVAFPLYRKAQFDSDKMLVSIEEYFMRWMEERANLSIEERMSWNEILVSDCELGERARRQNEQQIARLQTRMGECRAVQKVHTMLGTSSPDWQKIRELEEKHPRMGVSAVEIQGDGRIIHRDDEFQ